MQVRETLETLQAIASLQAGKSVASVIVELMKKASLLTNLTGEQKKCAVLYALQQSCEAVGLPYSVSIASGIVDVCVDLGKDKIYEELNKLKKVGWCAPFKLEQVKCS